MATSPGVRPKVSSQASPGEVAPLTAADLREWSDLMGQLAGWTFGQLRAPVLARGLAERMAVLGCPSYHAYYEQTAASKDATELAHLVELLVNRETSFFRNAPLYKAISDKVIPEMLQRARAGRAANVLSAGCSTGQEPYSLALVLAGQTKSDDKAAYSVRGADISRSALAFARRGRYSREDIESIPSPYRGYLQAVVDGKGISYELPETIRARTTFVWSNLESPSDEALGYDLIVCQNVLLYFRARSAVRLVHYLCSRLAPGGHLFLGPGEAVEAVPTGVETIPFPQARAFHRPE